MSGYSEERKTAVLRKLLPPMNLSVAEVSRQEGISTVTLYAWRNKVKSEGVPVPGSVKGADDWSAEAKLAVVIETAGLSEIELSRYCREKGIYVEQVRTWHQAALHGQHDAKVSRQAERQQSREDQKRIKQLERELNRKEKALAEAAALLVLGKKSRGDLGLCKGRLISTSDRQEMMKLIDETVEAGARRHKACEILGLSLRTLQRWQIRPEDGRAEAVRPEPSNKLSEEEREEILNVINQPEYASLPPTQIVPRLADQGRYLASESSFYRVMAEAQQNHRRGRSQTPRRVALPTTHTATGPNEVWSWDVTYLPTKVRGKYFYLYLFEDIYSRKTVGWEVYPEESGVLSAGLVQRAVMAEQCWRKPLILHSDNGAPMKSSTMLQKLYDLGITPSRGRPRVSDDNPFSESLFRTLKYCPQWPSDGFADIEAARVWVQEFVRWYNNEHRHSRIRFVTPSQRHRREDCGILAKRHEVYQAAKEKKPQRWSGVTRNWEPVGAVQLNPERQVRLAA
ncbi:IS3 family transposase [Ferrovum myxofaciens]|uniref:IS3 family transposase n=1 Tax=Ferrovum myxofaciens TaxID=416213 RepID=UPI002352CAEA|nr:IS3 family transposase [Ferrovum myxofaciens]